MAEVTIDVKIAGRTYPLKVSKHVETIVRKAEQMVNDKIVENEDKYYARDKQDSLAMAAIQITVEQLRLNQILSQEQSKASEELTEMESFLSHHLSIA